MFILARLYFTQRTVLSTRHIIVLSVPLKVYFLLPCVWLVFIRVVVVMEFVVSYEFQLRSYAGREGQKWKLKTR